MPTMMRFGSTQRSTEAPMQFEFTSRPSSHVKAVWARDDHNIDGDASSTYQRTHDALSMPPSSPMMPPAPPHQPPHAPNLPPKAGFDANNSSPSIFRFQTPPQLLNTGHSQHWLPPPEFSPFKAFPSFPEPEPLLRQEEDVDMVEASPPNATAVEKQVSSGSGGGKVVSQVKSLLRSRQRSRERRRLLAVSRVGPKNDYNDDEGESEDAVEEEENGRERRPPILAAMPWGQRMPHHYTVNMPTAPVPPSDHPNLLLGYLQFAWNLSLILLFLYLVVQFILTVQRDVEQRISEYSIEIVQEIAMCASQYKTNLCDENPIPAMAQPCADWKTCMSRDPTIVGRARVGAELIAEVVNGFVERLSWKTLTFTLTSLSFMTVFINALLSLHRSSSHRQQERQQEGRPTAAALSYPFPHSASWSDATATTVRVSSNSVAGNRIPQGVNPRLMPMVACGRDADNGEGVYADHESRTRRRRIGG